MNINTLTIKAQEALQTAISVARSHDNQAVEPLHILSALVADDDSLAGFLLSRVGAGVAGVRTETDRAIKSLPKVLGGNGGGAGAGSQNSGAGSGGQSGTGDQFFSTDSSRVIQRATDHTSAFGDRFASVEHLLLALLSKEGGEAARILKQAGASEKELVAAIKEFRKGASIDSQTSDQTFDALGKYALNLNELARAGKLDPVIGRDEEIRRVLQILSRRTKNNPILVGEPGVGKTAIAEGIAHRIVSGDIPDNLRSKQVFSLDMGALVAGAKYKGEFEERLKGVVKEVIGSEGEILLFIDEIHTLVGAGKGEGAMDAANILKPALARGELRTIGATTLDEYQKFFEKDKALERRFQMVMVDDPTTDDSISILRGLKERYESHHKVQIRDEAIIAAVELSHRYITSRFLPDKAIDLVDEAASRLRLEMNSVPEEIDTLDRRVRQLEIEREAIRRENDTARLESLTREIEELNSERNSLRAKWESERGMLEKIQAGKERIERYKVEAAEAERRGDYGLVAELRYGRVREAETEIANLQAELEATNSAGGAMIKEEVDAQDIAEVVSRWTGIPVSKMLAGEREKLLHMEDELHRRVVGQEEAIRAISDAVRRSRAGLSDARRPIGSFLFLGTTGVGKTELAKALAEFLFNDDNMLTRIDMSEYQERHSVSRLIGAPPGYIGYDEGGQLTEAVRRKPYSVVLLDEIEKAHPDVFNILLQVLDDGRLTDNKGRTVDFRNTIIIMTSNMGSSLIRESFGGNAHGDIFSGSESSSDSADPNAGDGEVPPEVVERTRDEVIELLKQVLKPEFLNRIDEVVMFTPLTRSDTLRIVDIQIGGIEKMLKHNGIELRVDNKARRWLADEGFDPVYGARPVKRAIQQNLVNRLSKEILAGNIDRERPVEVSASSGASSGLTFKN
ncbi:MAG: ATP-dependent chaperone ClpB [Alistipes sp.]|jgi:ATP-dependent Clp protease ATP-binding subunit ClpB|nr:ATP-dependent chaperone ClpB [Alistipes sp.]